MVVSKDNMGNKSCSTRSARSKCQGNKVGRVGGTGNQMVRQNLVRSVCFCRKIQTEGIITVLTVYFVTGTALISIWLVRSITAVPTIREFDNCHGGWLMAACCLSCTARSEPPPPPPPPKPPRVDCMLELAPWIVSMLPVNTTFRFKVWFIPTTRKR